jgi:hypothetical protein
MATVIRCQVGREFDGSTVECFDGAGTNYEFIPASSIKANVFRWRSGDQVRFEQTSSGDFHNWRGSHPEGRGWFHMRTDEDVVGE